jgi:hypothetical protein
MDRQRPALSLDEAGAVRVRLDARQVTFRRLEHRLGVVCTHQRRQEPPARSLLELAHGVRHAQQLGRVHLPEDLAHAPRATIFGI